MKGLRFTVPLLRRVIPLDSIQLLPSTNAKDDGQIAFTHKSPTLRPHTLLRIIRIETPLETVLPKLKPLAKVQPPRIEASPMQASRKKRRSSKRSSARPSASKKKKNPTPARRKKT